MSSFRLHQYIRDQVSLLLDRGLKYKGKDAWIKCPFHGGGVERTGSLRIRLDEADPKRFGTFQCFGCREWGSYNKLAAQVNLKQVGGTKTYDSQVPTIPFQQIREQSQQAERKIPIMPIDAFDWPEHDNWRNISGKAVTHILSGKMYFDTLFQEPKLFFPAYVNGDLVGGVRANIIPQEGNNYLNTKGKWTHNNFLFYDEAERMLQSMPEQDRVLGIAEGPRDAANLMQFGIPCVCNLGAANSWSKVKASLILAMSANRIILAFDGDKPGRDAAKAVYADLHKMIDVYDLDFPTDELGKKLFDASDLTQEQCQGLFDFREVSPELLEHVNDGKKLLDFNSLRYNKNTPKYPKNTRNMAR